MKKKFGKMLIIAAAACFMTGATMEVQANSSLKSQYEEIMAIIGGSTHSSKGSYEKTNNSTSGGYEKTNNSVSGGYEKTNNSTSGVYDKTNNSSSRRTSSTSGAGPGSTVITNDHQGIVFDNQNSSGTSSSNTSLSLPTVKEIIPSERFFKEFGIYEEGIDGKYFFYSNTGNGSITDKAVYVDIPQGMSYTVEYNGAPIHYESRRLLSSRGSYIFRFNVVHNEGSSLSTETEYKAIFRFRIDDKLPEETAGIVPSGTSLPSDLLEYQKTIEEMQAQIDSLSEEGQNRSAAEQKQEAIASEIVQEEPDHSTDKPVKRGEGLPTGFNTSTGLIEKYDEMTDFYTQRTLTGSYFLTSVQNGTITNDSVFLQPEKETSLLFEVTRNGEAFEYYPGDLIKEDGKYCVKVTGADDSFDSLYNGLEYPEFQFRIITKPINNLEALSVPEGETIISFTRDGNEVPFEGRNVAFEEDGVYELTYTTKGGSSRDVEITIDTIGPEAQIVVDKGVASIIFNAADVASLTLYKGDTQVDYPKNHTIQTVGKYRLCLTDEAGNESVYEFSVKRYISRATIILVVLAVILMATLGVFIVRIKKGTSLN